MSTRLPSALSRYVVAADAAVRDVARAPDVATIERAHDAVAAVRGVGALLANAPLAEVADCLLEALRLLRDQPVGGAATATPLSALSGVLLDAANAAQPDDDLVAGAHAALDTLRTAFQSTSRDGDPLCEAISSFTHAAHALRDRPPDHRLAEALLAATHATRQAAASAGLPPLTRVAAAAESLLGVVQDTSAPVCEQTLELLLVCARILPAMLQHRSDLSPFHAPCDAIVRRAAELVERLSDGLEQHETAGNHAEPATHRYATPHRLRARVVSVRGERYALDADAVERISTLDAEPMNAADAPRIAPLAELVGMVSMPTQTQTPATLVALRDTGWWLLVDEIAEARDLVERPLPSVLRRAHGIRGVATSPSGELLLTLDLPLLLATATPIAWPGTSASGADAPARPSEVRPVALIVDDSVTVRRRLGQALRQHGWECVQARDGLEALATLDERAVDLMLTDVDMPNVDGYALVDAARQRCGASLAIIVLATRLADERRNAAGPLVDGYLAKPFHDDGIAAMLKRIAAAPEIAAMQG